MMTLPMCYLTCLNVIMMCLVALEMTNNRLSEEIRIFWV